MNADHSETAATHRHEHIFLGGNHDEHGRRTLWVVGLTAAMMVVEIAAGWMAGSMALLADGLHMATHAGALGIGIESIQRLFAPSTVAYTEALWIAALGLIVNLARPGCSAATIITVHTIMDAAMGIVGAVVIARWSWGLLRDTGAVLVDAAANPSLEAELREAMNDGDAQIVDLHVWQVGPGRYAGIVSLIAANPEQPKDYAARVAMHEELVHLTVEVHRCNGHHVPYLHAA